MSADDPEDLTGLSEAPATDSLDGLLVGVAQAPQLRPPPGEGTRIGRYVLISRLGAGAMGVVWAAFDPQLDRKVALKILRRDPRSSDTAGRERAAREARALAKLIHPNIVAVHDGGIDHDALFVVMEFVDGVTLRGWLAEAPRSRDQILDAFGQAAAGLAAAHQAKLVHRDFKPDNVLVGKDGRVRVADFGLARIASAVEDDGEGPTPEGAIAGPAGTVTAGFIGTLAFMAPEQLERGAVDARADQFAFAVSLWTALYGVAPFDGKTAQARLASIVAGPSAPPADRGVPSWLHALVRRGLAARPDDRHPSMAALLAALERGRGRRRRIALGVAGVAALVALAPLVWMATTRPSAAAEPCAGGAAELATVWTPDRAVAIAATFPSNPAGEDGARRVRARLDGYAADWALAHRAACRATRVDRSQSEDMLERRMACLGRARHRLDAAVRSIGRPGADAEHADQVVDGLPRLATCADRDALARLVAVPEDPAVRARVDAATARFAEVATAVYDPTATDQVAASLAALEEARQAGWSPLIADAAHTHAEALYLLDRVADSVPVYREAVRLGLEAGDDRITVFAMADLAPALVETGGAEEAPRWLGLARAVAARNGDHVDALLRIAQAASRMADYAGDFDEAVAQSQAAVELVAGWTGDQDRYYAVALGNLAIALGNAGQLDESLAIHGRVLALKIALQGAGHPDVGSTLSSRGVVLLRLGRLDEARQDLARAIEIASTWYGPDAAETSEPLQNLGLLHLRRGDLDAARTAMERALAIVVARDVQGPRRARLEADLGIVEAQSGHLEAAVAHGERALAAFEALLGPDDPTLRPTLILIGRVERELGRPADSAVHLGRALVLAEAAGLDHPWTGNTRIEVALTAIARGRHAEAAALCERVLADAAAGVTFPASVAPEARLCLADALWRTGRDRARARRLAVEARDGYAALGEGFVPERDHATQWLAAHP